LLHCTKSAPKKQGFLAALSPNISFMEMKSAKKTSLLTL